MVSHLNERKIKGIFRDIDKLSNLRDWIGNIACVTILSYVVWRSAFLSKQSCVPNSVPLKVKENNRINIFDMLLNYFKSHPLRHFLQAPDFSGAFLRIGRSPHPSPGEPDHVTIGMRFCASSSSRFGGQAGADTAELGSFTCAGQKCPREENTWRHCLICRKG